MSQVAGNINIHISSVDMMEISSDEIMSSSCRRGLIPAQILATEKQAFPLAHSKTVFRVSSSISTSPAPPPRLHYSTFWKSISRRIYDKFTDEMVLSARAMSPKMQMPVSN